MVICSSVSYMDNIIFELNDVYFSYLGKFPALAGIDIKINQGQKISVIGANGSGKSTLLHLLDGLIFANRGRFSFCGKELIEKNYILKKIVCPTTRPSLLKLGALGNDWGMTGKTGE